MAEALDDVLARPSNGLTEDNRVTRTVRRTLTRYANDPLRIERNLVSVVRSLTRQMTVSQDLPASEENEALREAAQEGALAIRAAHPEVADARQIIQTQALEEMPDSDLERIGQALPVLEAISDDELAEEWREDVLALVADRHPDGFIPQLLNDAIGLPFDHAPPIGGVETAERIFTRAAKVSVLMSADKVADKLTAKLGISRGDLYGILIGLVGIGISILA